MKKLYSGKQMKNGTSSCSLSSLRKNSCFTHTILCYEIEDISLVCNALYCRKGVDCFSSEWRNGESFTTTASFGNFLGVALS